MGSRYLPRECRHGTTIDHGDFGPHYSDEDCTRDDDFGADGGCLRCFPPCAKCDEHEAILWAEAVERMGEVQHEALLGEDYTPEHELLYVLGLDPEATEIPRRSSTEGDPADG